MSTTPRSSHKSERIRELLTRADALTLSAMEAGWSGPPFDPHKLAEFLGIRVIPSADVREAQIVPLSNGSFRIEYNPNKPRARIRFSIAHEIAHTLFPDCAERVRHRFSPQGMTADDLHVEMLCNVAAAAFLMPIATFPE